MMTFRQGRAIAERYVATLSSQSEIEFAVCDEIIEEPWCWVFFYNSAAYLETESFSDSLVGNGPIVVEKEDGDVHELVTGLTIEEQLAALRDRLTK